MGVQQAIDINQSDFRQRYCHAGATNFAQRKNIGEGRDL